MMCEAQALLQRYLGAAKAPGNGVMARGQALLKRLPGDRWRLTPGE
jgi:hypothetical protein